MRIVIVEDEIKIREGMARLIESQTEHVVLGEAVNGEEGLEMILRFKPDLVITDIRMPKMDGLEMVAALHERKIPLHAVILSGYSEFEYARTAIRYGVDDYLLKPLDIDDIKNMLEKVEGKIRREQTTNGTPGMHLRNLITGEAGELEKDIKVLKDFCGFPDEGDYALFAGYIGSAEAAYREELEQFADELKTKYGELKLHYIYMENRQRAYLLGCVEKGGDRIDALEKSVYNRLVLRYRDRREKAVWTRKRFGHPEEIRGAAEELDSLLTYALVLEPKGWLDASAAGQYAPRPFLAPTHIYNQIRGAICQEDTEKLRQGTEGFLTFMSEGHFEIEEIRKAFVKSYYLIADTLQEIDSSLYQHLKSRNLLRNMENAVTWHELECAYRDVVQVLTGPKAKREDISNYVIKRAINYIREHYQEGLTQEEVASVLEITPEYLSTLFNREMGINFSVFLKQFRISHAKRLLKGTDMKVYEIAGAVGYGDPKYFQRVFKEETGVSPGDYRQMK